MINSTTNYEQFEFSEANRAIDATHVRRLKRNIKTNGLVQPIIVTSDGYIIDGQHRYHACRELGVPIQYVVRESMNMADVVELNNLSKRWSMLDKVQSFAAQGNDHYIKLLEFYEECITVDPKFSVRAASFIAQGSASMARSGSVRGNLGSGTWEFNSTMEHAKRRLHAIGHFRQWDFWMKSNFITAFLRCMRTVDGFDWRELLRKAQMYPHLFVYAGTTDDFMRVFETVYNHKKTGRNRKRFF